MRPDYDRIIDAETWAFIDRTNSFYPPETASRSIAEQRKIYDRMACAFRAPRPLQVKVRDSAVQGVPLRHYSVGGGQARLLFFHGGGFVVGGLDSHDDICAEITAATGFDLTAVDYRLAPEHAFPADLDDALTAWNAITQGWSGPVLLVGDSAGGTICAGLSHALRDAVRRPDGQVLIYPGLGFLPDTPSMTTHAEAPLLTRDDCLAYRDLRVGGDARLLADPRCSPLRADSFSRLPRTMIFAAGCDPLADEALAYARAIRADGGHADAVLDPSLVHGYLRARHTTARARASFARIEAAISEIGTLARD